MSGSFSHFVGKISAILGVRIAFFHVAWGTQTPAEGEE